MVNMEKICFENMKIDWKRNSVLQAKLDFFLKILSDFSPNFLLSNQHFRHNEFV